MLTEAVQSLLDREGVAAHQKVWVAVSGGADSMALLLAAHAVHEKLGVIHVDHGLRDGSHSDRLFVESEAARLKLECKTHVAMNLAQRAKERGEGLEAAARAERYGWFEEVVGNRGIVLTGHHADDQRETQLLHWLRGSKAEAWTGMTDWSRQRGFAVGRPFLNATRAQLVASLVDAGVEWKEDPSNQDPAHLRNRVRHELIPLLDDLRPGWSSGMKRHGELAKEWRTHSQALLDHSPQDVLPLAAIENAPSPRQLLSMWGEPFGVGARQIDALLHLAGPSAEVGAQVESASHVLVRERSGLMAKPLTASISHGQSWSPLPESNDSGELAVPNGRLTWSLQGSNPTIDPDENSAQLSHSALELPLTVRPWKEGDRMVPIGMSGHQKVSDILTQRKVDHCERKKAWVVCEASGRIAWLVGHRIHRDVAMPSPPDPDGWVLRLKWVPH